MFNVKDGDRVLQFDGVALAHSSSQRDGSLRWVEFELYKTQRGSYVLSRVAYSVVYHVAGCVAIRPGRHQAAQAATLTEKSQPCVMCAPQVSMDQAHEMVYPEKPIYWAQVCEDPGGVLAALSKSDDDGGRYYTHVARDLIRTAALQDLSIGSAYYVEHVQ